MGEVSEKHPLPLGLDLNNSYCDLTPGSAKVKLMIENITNRNITISAKAIVCQLNLTNKIPNLLLPTCKPEDKSEKHINEIDNFSPGQADLDDGDLGLTFKKVRAHQVLVQDLCEDHDEDFSDRSHDDEPDLNFVSDFTPKGNEQRNTLESEDCEDSGEWLLVIGTMYCNIHHSVLITSLCFPGLPPKDPVFLKFRSMHVLHRPMHA